MNRFKNMVHAGEQPVGTFVGSASMLMTEACAAAGFDYVIIDNEHSPIEAETSAQLIIAAESKGITPFCRVREISRPAILKLLDVGAQGLIVPCVKSVDEVRKLVEYTKYAPVGQRGFCPTRKDGWGYGISLDVQGTMSYFNDNVLLIPQCETVEALSCIEEIAALDGVDGIFIGPFDLSISMGIPGRFDLPEFQAALERIKNACHDAGKFCILFTMTPEGVIDGFSKGYDSMTMAIDLSIFIKSAKEALDAIGREH